MADRKPCREIKKHGCEVRGRETYRFGVLLEVREHPFDVFEVGGEGSVVEWEVPLPGGAALQINETHSTRFNKSSETRSTRHIHAFIRLQKHILTT